jgi:hypothetical protein
MAIESPSAPLYFAFMLNVEPAKLLTVAISLINPVKILNPFVKRQFCLLLEAL